MGMFDKVLSEANLILDNKCPACKHKLDALWQTKSYKNLLYGVSLRTLKNEVGNFECHTICDNCLSYMKLIFENNKIILEYHKRLRHSDKDKIVTKILPKKSLEVYRLLTEGKEEDITDFI